MVGCDGGRLTECLAAAPTEAGLPEPAPGLEAEVTPALPGIAGQLASRVERHGGAVLVVDYGRDGPTGDSVQAVRGHRKADPLERCGETDITAWVDFSVFRAAAEEHSILMAGPKEQGPFLRDLGIHARAEALADDATPAQRRELLAGVERLCGGAHMGTAFKALALLPAGTGLPVAGF